MNLHAVKDVLEQGVVLDAAVNSVSDSLRIPNTTDIYALEGIRYLKDEKSQALCVRLHGLLLVPKYEQIKTGDEEFAILVAKVTLCLPEVDGSPSKPMHSFLIDSRGNMTLGDETDFRHSMSEHVRDQTRYRLSLNIAEKVQAQLQRVNLK